MIKFNYDTKKYNFRQIVQDYLEFEDLQKIHKKYSFGEVLKEGTDQNQHLHRKFYDRMDADTGFVTLYKKFIEEVVAPRYEDEVLYQRFPTFRVHQPNNVGTFGWHKDSDYNHSPCEVNYFLPMTKGYDTNTVWHESQPGKKDYAPMVVEYGDIMEWDGANCEHGTKMNETEDTRISFDFRILPMSDYLKHKPKNSITKNTKFEIGGYFGVLGE